MKAQHTKTPWRADWIDNNNGWIIDEFGNYLFQVVTSDEEGLFVDPSQQKANAQRVSVNTHAELIGALKLAKSILAVSTWKYPEDASGFISGNQMIEQALKNCEVE